MDTRRAPNRRDVTKVAALALGGVSSFRIRQAFDASAMQPSRSPWTPADGLRLAGPVQEPATLDPALARDLSTNFLLRQIFRSLIRFDAGLRPVPDLAESIAVSDDGLTYRLVLRAAARFHDGRQIEADDVRQSFSRALRPATAGGAVASLPGVMYLGDINGAGEVLRGEADMLSGIRVLDVRTLDITLAQPSATFLMKLGGVPASIVDRHQLTTVQGWTAPNGSGPFHLESWTRGESMRMTASETWWGGNPRVQSVDIRTGPSASQPLNLYQAGEIDLVEEIPPDQVSLVADPASGIEVGALIGSDLFAVSYIAFGNGEPPLDDPHVRRAIKLAFPAVNIARAMFNGAVREASGLIPDGMLGTAWGLPAEPVDIGTASDEIARSRYGSADRVPPISVYGADVAPLEALRDTVGESLGLRIDVISVTWPDFLNGLATRRFPAYALYWGVDYPDPENLLWTLFGSDSPENYTGYRNEAFDSALAEARRTLDQERRAEIYADAHRILIEDVAVIPLFFDRQTTLARPGLEGLEVTPMGILGLETIGAST